MRKINDKNKMHIVSPDRVIPAKTPVLLMSIYNV